MKTTLVVVVNGSAYESFAETLFQSAEHFFHPTDEVEFLMLPGPPGWPAATMYRHHVLKDNMPDSDYVFLSDADMVFEGHVGSEVLPQMGVTATLHPGYVVTTREALPYEDREQSAAYVPSELKHRYYCGGFLGGTRQHTQLLSESVASVIDTDARNGITPRWHDESALNRALAVDPPQVTLSPSYCHPANSTWYETFWPATYERKLVALDKDNQTRGDR